MTKTDAFMFGFLFSAVLSAGFWLLVYNVWSVQ
jgi:hypothetical protein